MPDGELARLAAEAKLHDTNVIREQVERMLKHPFGEQFVKDLAAEWLDLKLIGSTEPDRKLYPGFDVIVQQSMLRETHAFLRAMLDDNLSVSNLIDSDFTFLDSRLARFYGIPRVNGDQLRRVVLQPEDHRGGLLTQGAVLKVTANGTTTSPVIRGVWVSERLLGEAIPPPPENVPAIEPDIRGAKTIREMLAQHEASDSCASCHVKIDPPGFALENYDPSGRWRDQYPRLRRGRRQPSVAVDASYTMPDGRAFENVREFQRLVLQDQEALARNVAEKLLIYGTGTPVRFADREVVESIVADAAESDFGFRSLVHAVVTSCGYQPTRYLKPIDDLRDQFTVVSGSSHPGVTGGHRAEASILTANPIGSLGGGKNAISIDQHLARHFGNHTRFPSLVLSSDGTNSPSYTEDGAMIPAESSPASLFTRMFVDDSPADRTKHNACVKAAASWTWSPKMHGG